MKDKTVFIVDNDPEIRTVISILCRSAGYSVDQFSSANEFIQCLSTIGDGCLILDIQMPGMDGIQLQEELSIRDIHIPIIFMTGFGNISLAVRAMKAGAVDFIEKPFSKHIILASIERCLKLERNEGKAFTPAVRNRFNKLTLREREVMDLIAQGYANKEIGARLNISHRTAENHRRNVMTKMGANSLSDILRMVFPNLIKDNMNLQ